MLHSDWMKFQWIIMSVMFMAKTENPEEALQILISETSPNHIYYFLLPLSSLTYQPLISNHTTEERDQIIL
jgi:hypothetical protein